MDGIVIGRLTTSNAIRVYNPRNKQYYEPESCRIDPFWLPASVYPTITYNGGLFYSLYRDTTPSIDKPYPPGTRVEHLDPHTNILKSGTVMDIPLPSSPAQSEYLIQFDNSTTATVSLSAVPSLADESSSLRPPFPQLNSKITYKHERNKTKDTWVSLTMVTNLFINVIQMLAKKNEGCSSRSPIRLDCAFKGSFFLDIKLPHSFVSPLRVTLLIQLLITSVLSIFIVLLPITILQSYYEEKDSIEIMGTFQRLTIAKYRALREKGAPKAIPTVCVLPIKKDENLMPLRAKSLSLATSKIALGQNLDVMHQFFVKPVPCQFGC
jgi:hypothetical protein